MSEFNIGDKVRCTFASMVTGVIYSNLLFIYVGGFKRYFYLVTPSDTINYNGMRIEAIPMWGDNLELIFVPVPLKVEDKVYVFSRKCTGVVKGFWEQSTVVCLDMGCNHPSGERFRFITTANENVKRIT